MPDKKVPQKAVVIFLSVNFTNWLTPSAAAGHDELLLQKPTAAYVITALLVQSSRATLFNILFLRVSNTQVFQSTLNRKRDTEKQTQLTVDGKHRSEGQVDSLFFATGVTRKAVKPVLLGGPLHQQKRAREQRESDKIRRTRFAAELKDSDGPERNGGHGRVPPQLGVNVGMPAAHVVALAVEVHEAGVELVTGHGDQTVQQVEKLRRPVNVLLQYNASVEVVARAVPSHQSCIELCF